MVRTALLLSLSTALTASVQAASIKLTNVGTSGKEIPLRSGSVVHFDPDGSLRTECDLNSIACLGGSDQPPPVGLPSASLSRTDADATLTAGESIRLAWTSNLGEVCKATSNGATSTTWAGSRAPANQAGETVALTAAGNYTFDLTCYNDAGSASAAQLSLSVAAANVPPAPPSGCNIVSADPAFQPPALNRINRSWSQVFSAPDGSPAAVYPGAISWPVPVGSHRHAYTTVAFTPNPGQSVQLNWDQVQARLGEYVTARPASGMFFGISPCPGDLRAPSYGSEDPFLQEGCREFASSASLVFTTKPGYVSDPAICKLDAGATYYLNIAPVDPANGIAPNEHSCEEIPQTSAECHVGVVIGTSS